MRNCRFLLSSLLLTQAAFAACPDAPAGMQDIQANSYYIDAHHSVIDPALKARNEASVKPLNDYLRTVSDNADRFLADGDAAAARCAAAWLDRWAGDRAMLGRLPSSQAQYQRKWMLAGLALAYLKIRQQVAAEQRPRIDAWLKELADAALAFATRGRTARNNHYYWVGLAVMATGVATGDGRYVDIARGVYDEALAAIQDDGSLPLELDRAGKALAYHNYALAPLVVMAELARKVHEDWYGRDRARLDALAMRVLHGLSDPSWFASRTGVAQEVPKGGILGWSEFYRAARPQAAGLIEPLQSQAPFRYPQLGGNLSVLAAKQFFEG